jgi:hypothetical protein
MEARWNCCDCDCDCSCTGRGFDKCEVCASVECGWNAGLLLLLPYPQRGLISAKPLSKAGSLHRIMAALTPMTKAHGSGEYDKGKSQPRPRLSLRHGARARACSISEPGPLIHLTSRPPGLDTLSAPKRIVFVCILSSFCFINTCFMLLLFRVSLWGACNQSAFGHDSYIIAERLKQKAGPEPIATRYAGR